MMTKFLSIAVVILCAACQQKSEHKSTIPTPAADTSKNSSNTTTAANVVSIPTNNPTLITTESFANINKNATLEDIKKLVAPNKITEAQEPAAPETEETVPVTIINKGTPEEIIIRWKEAKKHKEIATITTRQRNAPYTTTEGIKVGTTLAQLEAINKDIISFSGIAWGFGGFIINYGKNGLLSKARAPLYSIRLGSNLENYPPDYPMGDQTFTTAQAKVKKHSNTLIVSELELNFY